MGCLHRHLREKVAAVMRAQEGARPPSGDTGNAAGMVTGRADGMIGKRVERAELGGLR